MVTSQPRKARKTLFNLSPRERRKQIASHLSEELAGKYGKRAVVLRKGDTVKILRGEFKGTTGKVLSVDTRGYRVTVEGATNETAKHAQKPRALHASNLLITKLDLTDPLRRAKLGATEADLSEEDRAKPKMEKKAKKAESEAEHDHDHDHDHDHEHGEDESPKRARGKKKAEEAEE